MSARHIGHSAGPAAVPHVRVISFGYLHSSPPIGAHLVLDVRQYLRDPAAVDVDAVPDPVMHWRGRTGRIHRICELDVDTLGQAAGAPAGRRRAVHPHAVPAHRPG